MTYQKVTGPLMSHSVCYDGQDAYNDMFVVEGNNESKLGRITDRSDLNRKKLWGVKGCRTKIILTVY